jgi:UDP-glucose 4-epimerase
MAGARLDAVPQKNLEKATKSLILDTSMKRVFVTGGAGFIGANLIRRLLARDVEAVTVFDNFSVGKRWHLDPYKTDGRLAIVEGDARDIAQIRPALAGHDTVFHLASNSDIAKAAEEPLIDFDDGTRLTQNVLEAMRLTDVKRILFTSGSGVYGDVPPEPIPEAYPHMQPISTYGAQKLASEVLISAYCHMFDFKGSITRFANVVGPLMTHGVTHDFIHRLKAEPRRLRILGNGMQTKPYIHVDDIISAQLQLADHQTASYACYNVASTDQLTVTQIAELVVTLMGLKDVAFDYTGGDRGWRADVPTYSLDTSRIRALGWSNKFNSREAVTAAARSLICELNKEPAWNCPAHRAYS